MKKTPLHDKHLALNAKMGEYAGFDMPIQYAGIKEEVLAVREKVGIFDVSHMGEIRVTGTSADAFLNWVLSRDISGKKTELVSYAILLYEAGGAVDDLLAYRFQESGDYWLVVNAANKDKDFAYLNDILPVFYEKHPEAVQDVKIADESEFYAQIAVQGPKSPEIMKALLEQFGEAPEFIEKVLGMKSYRMQRKPKFKGDLSMVISRTGYTGEDGFEIYLPAAEAGRFWDALIKLGAEPAGLGARDTLRLEAGMPLYGHEMSQELNPLDAGVGFAVKTDRPFIAAGKLVQHHKLIPLISEGRAIPREGYPVFADGKEVGHISSGTFSPTLGKGIAYALVDPAFPDEVEELMVEVHRKEQPFRKTTAPFVKRDR